MLPEDDNNTLNDLVSGAQLFLQMFAQQVVHAEFKGYSSGPVGLSTGDQKRSTHGLMVRYIKSWAMRAMVSSVQVGIMFDELQSEAESLGRMWRSRNLRLRMASWWEAPNVGLQNGHGPRKGCFPSLKFEIDVGPTPNPKYIYCFKIAGWTSSQDKCSRLPICIFFFGIWFLTTTATTTMGEWNQTYPPK